MDAKILHELFDYCDGELYWKVNRGTRARIGNKVGSLSKSGYLRCKFNGKMQKVHRIIFLMNYGYLPKEIDHIDGNPLNNRIENLREATTIQNQYNAKKRCDNTSGVKGVYLKKSINKWCARIRHNKARLHIGYFETLHEAEFAIKEARKKLHGEFANNG